MEVNNIFFSMDTDKNKIIIKAIALLVVCRILFAYEGRGEKKDAY